MLTTLRGGTALMDNDLCMVVMLGCCSRTYTLSYHNKGTLLLSTTYPYCGNLISITTSHSFVVPCRLLGGPWDLVTTYNWAYNPTYIPLNGLIGVTPIKVG